MSKIWLTVLLLSVATTSSAMAATSVVNLGTLGGVSSVYGGMTADGVVIGGDSKTAGGLSHAYRWENGTMTDLGTLGGSTSSYGGMSTDGSVIGGNSYTAGNARQHAYRWENGTMTDLGTLGGSTTYFGAISADGSVIAGDSSTAISRFHAYRWTNGIMTDLGTLGGLYSYFGAMSADGAIIAGNTYIAGSFSRAYRWTNGMMTNLGTLGGLESYFGGMSADGAVIAGDSFIAGNAEQHAYRWANGTMTDLGTLGGAMSSYGGMSADGAVIAGNSDTAGGFSHAYRWSNGTMTDLGTLGGSRSSYGGMSADGSVIAGSSTTPGNAQQHAYRWANGAMTDLGTLGGSTSYFGGVSADGSVIAGSSTTPGEARNLFYRWRADTGMKSLEQLLTTAGVNMAGWDLSDDGSGNPIGMSANGQIIAGTATVNGNTTAFLFREVPPPVVPGSGSGTPVVPNAGGGVVTPIVPGGNIGIITPGQLAASIATATVGTRQVTQTTVAQVGQSLFLARQLVPSVLGPMTMSAPVSRVPMPASPGSPDSINAQTTRRQTGVSSGNAPQDMPWTVYSAGGFGIGQNNDTDNHDFNGTVGIRRAVTPAMGIGIGVIGAHAQNDMMFGGNSDLEAYGLSGIAAFTPVTSGLRVYGSVFAAHLDLDIRRGYANGAGLDSSRGETDGITYGAAGQVGWQFGVADRVSVMPYAELRWSRSNIDGYDEQGGAFAASFGDQDVTNIASRLGIEPRFALTPDVTLLGRVAWGHRLNNDAGGINANVSGLTTGIGNDAGDRDWAEGTVGVNWQATDRTTFGAELTGRSGNTAEPQLSAIASVGIRF